MAESEFGGKKPFISVCIPNYNGQDIISECVESVRNQEIDFPVEIIIRDDASIDDSVNFIREKYPDCVLIEGKGNAGYCVSNNLMTKAARGKYILLLNNDACLMPDALKTLYEYGESLSEPAILGLPQYDMGNGTLVDRGNFFDPFLNPVPNKNKNLIDVGMVTGACLWVPKLLWDDLEGFPEWFHMLAEDTYLCCIARNRNITVQVLPDSGFKHWIGRSIGGGKVREGGLYTSYKRRYRSELNKTYVMSICYPNILLLTLIPLHLIALVIEGFLLTMVKRDAMIWRRIYGKMLKALWKDKFWLLETRWKKNKERCIGLRGFLDCFVLYPYKIKMLLLYGLPMIKQ